MQKCGKPFSQNFSYYSKLSDFFTTSNSRCSRSSFFETSRNFLKLNTSVTTSFLLLTFIFHMIDQ
ncbi:hypothetical protein E6L37_01380 [Enterococcus lactis]|uniref:Uncharacterized protein n=1 Tax=Enterococcus faecium TaxID=1352 RepID=A0AAI8PXC9_ENTFC|nr:hypothetical protein D9Z05_00890 [Enterococcus faecium]TKB01256.1 hypothetical protein E6L37_01380 [Enterococcus lactis]